MGNICRKDDTNPYADYYNDGYESGFTIIFDDRPDLFILVMESTKKHIRQMWMAQNKYYYIDRIRPLLTDYQVTRFEQLVNVH